VQAGSKDDAMIDSVRLGGAAPPDRVNNAGSAPVRPSRAAPVEKAEPSAVGAMAARGAPVDMTRVSAVRAAIAEGRYAVDPDAIAARMLASDMPTKLA